MLDARCAMESHMFMSERRGNSRDMFLDQQNKRVRPSVSDKNSGDINEGGQGSRETCMCTCGGQGTRGAWHV